MSQSDVAHVAHFLHELADAVTGVSDDEAARVWDERIAAAPAFELVVNGAPIRRARIVTEEKRG